MFNQKYTIKEKNYKITPSYFLPSSSKIEPNIVKTTIADYETQLKRQNERKMKCKEAKKHKQSNSINVCC